MIYPIIIGLLGLCLGSFVNALVWRIHEQSKPMKKRAAGDKELSVISGRSMCPNCKHTLSTKDLLPVISWLTLGGKCRYCSKPISWQYPLVEMLTALLFVVVYLSWPSNLDSWSFGIIQIGMFLSATVVGVALSVYDFKWMLLPDRLVKIFSIIAIFYAGLYIVKSDNPLSTVFQLVLAILVSGGLFYVLYQISDGKWIGGGDVKLGFPLGLLLLTPINSMLMLFMASLLGCAYALLLLIVGKYKKNIHIPFGPFLLLATYIVVLYGSSMINLYKNLIYP